MSSAWQRFWRIRTEETYNAANPDSKAEWNIGGNEGGGAGWMDIPISKDGDGLQSKAPLIWPTPASGSRSMNTADPVQGALPPELGSLDIYVYPELVDRFMLGIFGEVARVETAGSAALASTAFASLAALDTQPDGTEMLKFVIASSTAASAAKINIIQGGVTVETIDIGTNAGTVNGTYYSKGGYNGSVNPITFSVEGTVTAGMVTVSGVDYVTNTHTQLDDDMPGLVIEQAGRAEAGAGNSEYFPGVIIPTFQLSYDRGTIDSLLMANATLHGLKPTIATSGTFQNDAARFYRPIAAWNAAITIDGVDYAEVVAANITFQTNNELHAVSSGGQSPTDKFDGEFEIFGELTILAKSNARWQDLENAQNRAMVINFLSPHYVVDTTPYQYQISMSRVFFGDYTRIRRNQAQAATIPFRAVRNSTDSGPGKVVTRCRMPV